MKFEVCWCCVVVFLCWKIEVYLNYLEGSLDWAGQTTLPLLSGGWFCPVLFCPMLSCAVYHDQFSPVLFCPMLSCPVCHVLFRPVCPVQKIETIKNIEKVLSHISVYIALLILLMRFSRSKQCCQVSIVINVIVMNEEHSSVPNVSEVHIFDNIERRILK